MVRTILMAGAMLLVTCYSYAQKCDCDLIKKRNDNHADNSLQDFMNGNFIQQTAHPYTTFRRDDIGGTDQTGLQRIGSIRTMMQEFIVDAKINNPSVAALYQDQYLNANLNLTSTNCNSQPSGYCENARIAKNAAFVYLSNVDNDGNTLSSAESQALRLKAIRAIMRMKDRADENEVLHWTLNGIFRPEHFEEHFIWHTKSLIMYLQAYDYLMTGLAANPTDPYADSIEACGHLLQCYTAKIYRRANHAGGYLSKRDTRALYTAGALGLASIVLSDHSHRAAKHDWLPFWWADAAHYSARRALWGKKPSFRDDKRMALKIDEFNAIEPGTPVNLSGYAEGPFQFRLGFENLTPFYFAMHNANPSPELTLPNLDTIPNYLEDREYQRLYEWYNIILYPDGTAPAYDQGVNGSGFPGIAMLQDPVAFNNFRAELQKTDFIDLSADIVAAAANGFFEKLKTNSNSLEKKILLASGDYAWHSSTDLDSIDQIHYFHMKVGYFDSLGSGIDESLLGTNALTAYGLDNSNATRKGEEYNKSDQTSFTIYAGRIPLIMETGNLGLDYRNDYFATSGQGVNSVGNRPIRFISQHYRPGFFPDFILEGELRKNAHSSSNDEMIATFRRKVSISNYGIIDHSKYGPIYSIDDQINFPVGIPLEDNLENLVAGYWLHGNGSASDGTFIYHGADGNFTYTHGCTIDANDGWGITGKVTIQAQDTATLLPLNVQWGSDLSNAEVRPGNYYSSAYDKLVAPTVNGNAQISAFILDRRSALNIQERADAMVVSTTLQPYRCSQPRPSLKLVKSDKHIGTLVDNPIDSRFKHLHIVKNTDSRDDMDTVILPFGDSTVHNMFYRADRVSLDVDTDPGNGNCEKQGLLREIHVDNGNLVQFDTTVIFSSKHIVSSFGMIYDSKFFYSGEIATLEDNDTIKIHLPDVPPDSVTCMTEVEGIRHFYDTTDYTMNLYIDVKGTYTFRIQPCDPCVISCFFPPDSIDHHFIFNSGSTERLGHMLTVEDTTGWLDMSNGSKMIICPKIVCHNKASITLVGGLPRRYSKGNSFKIGYRDNEGSYYRDTVYIGSDVTRYWDFPERTMIVIQGEGALVLDSASYTQIGGGGSIYVKTGGTLKIRKDAHVVIGNETIGFGEIIAEDGAYVCIEPGALVEFYNDTLDSTDRQIFYISQNPQNPAIAGVAPESNASPGNCVAHCALKNVFPSFGIGNHEHGWFNVGKPRVSFDGLAISCDNSKLKIYGQATLNETRFRVEVCEYDTIGDSCLMAPRIIPLTTIDKYFAGRIDDVDLRPYLSNDAGVYKVTLQVMNDCYDSAMATEVITIHEQPTAVINGDSVICGGYNPITVSGSNSWGDFTNYTWEVYEYKPLPDYILDDQAWDTFSVTIDTIYTDSMVISGLDTSFLDSLKILSITYDTIYYHTKDTADTGDSKSAEFYQGQFDTSFVASTVSNFNFPGYYFNPGSKYAIILHLNGYCDIRRDTLIARTKDGPDVSAGPDKSIPFGSPWVPNPNLEGSVGNATSYSWSPTTALTPSTTLTPKASPSSTTKYVLSGTDADGCKNTDTMRVIVNTIAHAGRDTVLCSTATVQVGTAAVSGYAYRWSPASAVSNNKIAQPTALATASDVTLILKVYQGTTLVGIDDVQIKRDVPALPNFSVNPGGGFYEAAFEITQHTITATDLDWDYDDGTGSHTNKSSYHAHTFPSVPSTIYDVCVSYTNACGLQETCKDCEFDISGNVVPIPIASSVNQPSDVNEITLQPNPFKNTTTLTYDLDQNVVSGSVEIFDITGKNIKTYDVSSAKGSIQIDLSEFAEGVYRCNFIVNGVRVDTRPLIMVK